MYARKKSISMKLVVLLLAVVMVFGCAVGGTLAYLKMQTTSVVNTFTTSNVTITLTETKPENQTAKMVPGATIEKNPKVTVEAGSEACYVYVKIEKTSNFDTYMSYEVADGWATVETGDNYVVVGRAATAGESFEVLKDNVVNVKSTVTKTDMTNAETSKPTLTFIAYAIQSANLKKDDGTAVTTVTDAWALVGSN